MTDQKPERYRIGDGPGDSELEHLTALETISAQLDYLITMMYGQKQEEHYQDWCQAGAEADHETGGRI